MQSNPRSVLFPLYFICDGRQRCEIPASCQRLPTTTNKLDIVRCSTTVIFHALAPCISLSFEIKFLLSLYEKLIDIINDTSVMCVN